MLHIQLKVLSLYYPQIDLYSGLLIAVLSYKIDGS